MPPKATAARPALLVVDPDDQHRHTLAHGLAAYGYEVVPTLSAQQGLLYARTLGPAVIVAPASLEGFGDGAVLAGERDNGRQTLVLLGATAEQEADVPESALFLLASGLSPEELVRRIRLVLVGREIGADADPETGAVVGDLALLSTLELVRAAQRIRLSGTVVLEGGVVELLDGNVVAATAGSARGVKAFCRLARRHDGPFHLQLERPAVDATAPESIRRELTALIIEAIEDVVAEPPDGRLQVRRTVLPAPSGVLSPLQQEILSLAREGEDELTVAIVVDTLAANDGTILTALSELRDHGLIELVEPQSGVRVVTDSTSDLPSELARRHGIAVIPLKVLWGKRVFRDGIDITPKTFYELLEKTETHPSTSPPADNEFLDLYAGLAGDRDLVSVHVSAKLSQTWAGAGRACENGKERLGDLRPAGHPPQIAVIDSRSVSLGVGLLALFAARMAERGQSAAAIVARLEAIRERMPAMFVVDTLEYLARGGRIGKARALLGGLLGIKPILGVVDGEIVSVDKVRGGRQAQPRMIELFAAKIDRQRPVLGGVVHANAPIWADRLKGQLEKAFRVRELILAEIGPVVGTHAGPGTVGAALYQPVDDDELALIGP